MRNAIAQAEALFDHPDRQYILFKDLQDRVFERRTPGVPDRFEGCPRAQSYFGLFRAMPESDQSGLTEDQMVGEAFHIDETVQNAVQSHSINPSNIEGEIRKKLLPRYFNLLGGLDAAKALIEQILVVVRAGRTKDAA